MSKHMNSVVSIVEKPCEDDSWDIGSGPYWAPAEYSHVDLWCEAVCSYDKRVW